MVDLPSHDVALIGGGPAAALLAQACLQRGLSVIVIAEGGLVPAPHTLCAFAKDVTAALAAERWDSALFVDDVGARDVGAYVRVDTAALVANARGVDVKDARAVAVSGGVVGCTGGGRVTARVVVDCTGRGAFVGAAPASVFQTALGLRLRGVSGLDGLRAPLFMDWSSAPVDDDGPPSFLYVLPHDDGTVLLEETALAARPAVSLELLRARLLRRLTARGIRGEVVATERVSIAMDQGLPVVDDVFAFGAAAGLVHPTTGFQIGAAIAAAPVVADAIVRARAGAPRDIARAATAALWTKEKRATRAMLLFALEGALALQTKREAARFFRAFFDDEVAAHRWLNGTASAAELRARMLEMFSAAPWDVRSRMLATAKGLPQLFASLVAPTRVFGAAGGRL